MSPGFGIDLLVMLVISGRQSAELVRRLSEENFYFTQIDSSGGMIQEPTVTFLIGLSSRRSKRLYKLVEDCCKTYHEFVPMSISMQQGIPPISMVEVEAGGALVFAMNVVRFEQIL